MLKDSVDAQDRLFINNNSSSSSYSYQRQLLPIFNYKSHILYAIEKYSVVVLISDTGTGKSTQIPQYLVESGWASEGSMILCTQPRRVAVMTISDRVAKERNSILGEEVGYSIRFEKKLSEELTKIKYCTDGVLIREMMSDPMLLRYSVIMIDEAHERSLNTDILFGLLKKVQKKRPELRIIVASATMDAQIIKSFFETNTKKPSSSSSSVALVNINSSSITNTQSVGLKRKGLPITTVSSTLTSSSNDDNDEEEDSCCILQITGKMYQVDICYLSEPCRNYLQTTIDTVLNIHKYEDTGDILVFLPGSEDIDDVIRGLRELYTGSTLYFLPLYAALHTRAQLEVFKPTPDGYRKVVIATNIAETSITIPGVKYVIDSGFVKLNYFDFHRGVEMLITCPISQASAQQRAGRCGRTQPGKCFRLLTESAYSALPFHTVPEIQRVNVSWSILQMKVGELFIYLYRYSVHIFLLTICV